MPVRRFLTVVLIAAALLVAAGPAAAAPVAFDFEAAAIGAVPAGCVTPAGRAAAVVSADRAYAGSRSLKIDDQTSQAMTAITCSSASQSGASLAFAAFPEAANGFMVDILGTTTVSGTPSPVFHLLVAADGSISSYDGAWHQFAPAGSVPPSQWSQLDIAVPSNYSGAYVSVGGRFAGTGGKWGAITITGVSGFGFASTGTVPVGDRVYVDSVSFAAVPAMQTFENEPVGAVPTGCVTPAGKTPAVVSNQRAYNSAKSLLVNDQSTSAIVQIVCDRPSQRGADLRFAAYPGALPNGFLIDINGTRRGIAGVSTIFHLAVTAGGGISWYDGGVWTPLALPGTVPLSAWSTFQLAVPADQSAVYLTVNGEYVGEGGPQGVREATSITGYGFASNGTPTSGDTVFLDDVGFAGAASMPPGAKGSFTIGPPVTIAQSNTIVQMPNTAVVVPRGTGQRVLVSYPAHADTSNTNGNEYAYSDDGGASWVDAQGSNPMPAEASYNMTRLRNGTLLAVNYHTYMVAGNLQATVDSAVSADNGTTWTRRTGRMVAPQEMRQISSVTDRPGSPLGGFVLVHSVIENPDGTLLQSGYGYYKNDSKYRQIVLASADGGLNWTVRATVAVDPALTPDGRYEGFCEGGFERAADGSLFMAMRIGGYLPMYFSRSTDNGATWSAAAPLRNGGGFSTYSVFPSLVKTGPDTLVMLTGRPGLSLLISTDGGRSWARSVTADYQNSANGSLVALDSNHLLVFGDRGANWSSPTPSPYGVWSRQVSL